MVKWRSWLQLIRWPNLLLLALSLVLIRLFIIIPLGVPFLLSWTYLIVFIVSVMAVAAGGYIVNDIFDQAADAINKPHKIVIGKTMTEGLAWQAFFFANLLGVVGFYLLSRKADYHELWYIPVLVGILLYFYSSFLKGYPVVGNLLVAFLTALPIFLMPVFDQLPLAEGPYAASIKSALEVIFAFGFFAFLTNWIREMVKDCEDQAGDAAAGLRTLPIVWGLGITKWIIAGLSAFLLAGLLWYSLQLWRMNNYVTFSFALLLVVLPKGYFMLQLVRAQKPRQFALLSNLMKMIMLAGMLSMVTFTYRYYL